MDQRFSIKTRHIITVWSIALGFFGIVALFVSIMGIKSRRIKWRVPIHLAQRYKELSKVKKNLLSL